MWSSGLSSHGSRVGGEGLGGGGGGGERATDRVGERERATHPLSHVFDRGVFPTGVKKGRADWAE